MISERSTNLLKAKQLPSVNYCNIKGWVTEAVAYHFLCYRLRNAIG